MESANGVRPVQTTSQAPARVITQPERQVARTELPESKVITALARVSNADDASDNKISLESTARRLAEAQQARTSRVERDDATKELVFRTVSASTGQVISQYPDEAILRERAYRANQARQELLQEIRKKPSEGVEQATETRAV